MRYTAQRVVFRSVHFPRIHKFARIQIKCSANFAQVSTVRCHLIMPQWGFLCRMMHQSVCSYSVYINTLSLLLLYCARALRRMCSWMLCVQLLLTLLLSIRVLCLDCIALVFALATFSCVRAAGAGIRLAYLSRLCSVSFVVEQTC